MNDVEKLTLLARRCRKTLKQHLSERYDEDLSGACGVASWFLMREARRNGIYTSFVQGGFLMDHHEYPHCWIEYNGKIFDLTASQFRVIIPVLISNSNDSRYLESYKFYNLNDAKDYIKSWSMIPDSLYKEKVKI